MYYSGCSLLPCRGSSRTLDLARSAEIANNAAQGRDALRLTARDGKAQLLTLAGNMTACPEDYSDQRRAKLLLDWAECWVQPDDWTRLSGRVRKRRQRQETSA